MKTQSYIFWYILYIYFYIQVFSSILYQHIPLNGPLFWDFYHCVKPCSTPSIVAAKHGLLRPVPQKCDMVIWIFFLFKITSNVHSKILSTDNPPVGTEYMHWKTFTWHIQNGWWFDTECFATFEATKTIIIQKLWIFWQLVDGWGYTALKAL